MNTFTLQKEALSLIKEGTLESTVDTAGIQISRKINIDSCQSFYLLDSVKTYTKIVLSNDFTIYGRLSGVAFSPTNNSYYIYHFENCFYFYSSELRNPNQNNACFITESSENSFDLNLYIKIPYLSRHFSNYISSGKDNDAKFPLLIHFIVLYKDELVDAFFTQPFFSTTSTTIYLQNKKIEKNLKKTSPEAVEKNNNVLFLSGEIEHTSQTK